MRRAIGGVCAAMVLALAGCGGKGEREKPGPSFAGQPQVVGGLQVPARATETAVQLGMQGGFRDRFWSGVNLGSTTPSHLPGEVSARAVDYRRWFPEMGALGTASTR